MSKNIFTKPNFIKFFIFLFVFSFSVLSFSFAQTKTAGQTCVVKSSGSDCVSGYRCVTSNPGQAKAGDSGICTVISQGNTSAPLPTFSDIGDLITNFNKNVVQNLIVLLGGAALVVFLWGMVLFIVHRQQAKGDLSKDKDMMLWGLVGLFVFVSVWGIIKLFQGFLGVSGTDMVLPRVCVNGSCNAGSDTSSSGGVGGTSGDKGFDNSKLITGEYDTDKVALWKADSTFKNNATWVAQLQKILNDKDGATLTIDGKFGAKTTDAVKAFQTHNKLVSDGIVGVSTKAVILYRYLGATPTGDTYSTQNWGDLSVETGSVADITNLQKLMTDIGCYSGTIDGDFGPATDAAVKLFQKNNYLIQDGIVGPSTRAVILDADTVGC
jgi:peptidoglycan hydrolase-like protein with peptidoglycan-binding domain